MPLRQFRGTLDSLGALGALFCFVLGWGGVGSSCFVWGRSEISFGISGLWFTLVRVLGSGSKVKRVSMKAGFPPTYMKHNLHQESFD